MLNTKITELLGIRYPVLQGGMAWIADASLAAAVSNAGGLGIIAAGSAPASYVQEQIAEARRRTNRPFGVNIMLMSPYAAEIAALVAQERVAVVTTGAGNPAQYMELWKQAGVKVIPVVPSVALAKRMQRYGADAVVAEGTESGGHIGELTTMAMTPQVVDAVDIPVIAAGGIADGRGMAAAFMLGAEGVQVGTRFLVAHECTVHENYKKKVLAAGDTDTAVTGRSTGHPVRGIKNKLVRKYRQLETEGASVEELEEFASGALRKAAKEGDLNEGAFMAGQSAGLVKQAESAQEIVENMTAQAEALLAAGMERWSKRA